MFRTHLKTSLALAALLLVSAPGLALADDAPSPSRFGDSGQVALHLSDGLSTSQNDIVTGPEIQVDDFVAPHLSLGLMLGANWYSSSAVNASSSSDFVFRVGPRIGYDIPLTEYVSWWPQVGVDFRFSSSSTSDTAFSGPSEYVGATSQSSTTSTSFALAAVAPIVIHPSRGFFIGAGPSFYSELSNSSSANSVSVDNSKVTSVGLMATIGGAI